MLIRDGDTALLHGDYDAAVAAYAHLAERATDEETARNALMGLARAHLRDQSNADAIDALHALLDHHPGSDQAQTGTFLLGDALVAAGEPVSATEAYADYLRAGTVITPYVNAAIGEAFRAAGLYTSARPAYSRALEEAPSRSFEAGLREKIALTYVAQEQYPAAVDQYDAILAMAQLPGYRARVGYQAAETLMLAGETEEAYARYAEVVERYPTEEAAYSSLVRLVQAGRPVDDLLRGKVDYYAEAYGPAVGALYRYINAYPDTHSGDAHWYAGLSYAEAGSTDLAIREFQLLIETHPESARRGDAWLELADLQASTLGVDQALELYREFVDAEPDHPLAPRALWEAGRLLERDNRHGTAAALYTECQSSYPESDVAPSALFRAGLEHHRAGSPDQAIEAWETVIDQYAASDRAAPAGLWSGKLLLDQGETERGLDRLEHTASSVPDDYYGIRAAELLSAHQPANLSTDSPLTSSQVPPDQPAGVWLARWLELDEDEHGATEGLSPRLAASPHWQRGKELWGLDRFQDARAELEALRSETYDSALDQYQLAVAYADLGLYRSSILCSWRVIGLSPVTSTLDAPRSVLELAYPTHYEDLVVENASKVELDPLLVYSLIRQESLFESLATSSASAQGLMQVIPPTGAEIFAELSWPPGYTTSDLYLPYVSLRFGTHYLATQRDRFGGRIDAALAAYNGGPYNAARWLESAGEDPDRFVEEITFSETRLYVRRIREHLQVYEALYSDGR